jgi:hypothetical protein
MRTQFSSANKLARFGKIEAVITMRMTLVMSRIALSSHYVVVQEHLAMLPERAEKLWFASRMSSPTAVCAVRN